MSTCTENTPNLADEFKELAARVEAGEFVGVSVLAFGADLNIHFAMMGAAVDDPLTALGAIEVVRARLIAAIEASTQSETAH